MKIEVLIPTINKSKDDIFCLLKSSNFSSDILIANQCGQNITYNIKLNSHNVRVICTDSIGVSINRNILLKNCQGDICICIDDDCSLVNGYEKMIISFFKKHSEADIISFNGFYVKHNNRVVSKHKTCKIKRFNQISYAGAPGIVFKKSILTKHDIHFREDLGVPNEICLGEDSMFYYDILKSKIILYRSKDLLFSINNDDFDSTYFDGITKKYVKSKGFVTFLIHKKLYKLYMIRHLLRFHKRDKTKKYSLLKQWFMEGVNQCKK